MSKSNPFSIYLLKKSFDAENSIKEDCLNRVKEVETNLPDSTKFLLSDTPAKQPWWKDYFDIDQNITGKSNGAIVFYPLNRRVFALTFGHVIHNLKKECYEYDFGLKVTLNCVDPDKLKNIDTLQPITTTRQRTQRSISSTLTNLEFDRDSTILKSLTGQVYDEYVDFFKNATGTSGLRIKSPVASWDLSDLLSKLLDLYGRETYKTTFPDIQNIVPIKDPAIVEKLNEKLAIAVQNKEDTLVLGLPEFVDYSTASQYRYIGFGNSSKKTYDSVYLQDYFDELEEKDPELVASLDLSDLKKHQLQRLDENGYIVNRHSILDSLIFDTTLAETNETFHYLEGEWFQVSSDYVSRLNNDLSQHLKVPQLPDYSNCSEPEYNKQVAKNDANFICLDSDLVKLPGESAFELCDLCRLDGQQVSMYHIKRSTRSSSLSHLFNQGVNSIEFLLKVQESVSDAMIEKIRSKRDNKTAEDYRFPLKERKVKVSFAIITKRYSPGADALPLFSRVTLRRSLQTLNLWNIEANFGFIRDVSDGK